MREKTTITIPASRMESVEFTVCDLCPTRIRGGAGEGEATDWSSNRYEYQTVGVFSAVGTAYPDGGGERVTKRFDICKPCFDNKVCPALEALGAFPHRGSIDH